MKKTWYVLMLMFVIGIPASSRADSVRMNVQPNCKGNFVITGQDVSGVQSLNIEIEYDSIQLDDPVVQPIIGGDLIYIKAISPGKLFISIYRSIAHSVP